MVSGRVAAQGGWGEDKGPVSATGRKNARMNVMGQPDSVVGTAADRARGDVDATVPAQVAIKSNNSGGYMLEFSSQGDFMRQILVRGLATDVQLSPAGGAVMQPSTGAGITRATLVLEFRFILAEAAQVGTYLWPMRISITPL